MTINAILSMLECALTDERDSLLLTQKNMIIVFSPEVKILTAS